MTARTPLRLSWMPALALAVALCSTTQAQATQGQSPFGFYFGAATIPLAIEGLEDVHVSDWETFSLAEGRIALPLSAGNMSEIAVPGMKLGFSLRLPYYLSLGFELGGYIGNLNAFTMMVGVDVFVIGTDWVRLGFMARGGGFVGEMSFANTAVLSGFTAPVITNFGTINNGDKVSASLSGAIFSGGVAFELDIAGGWAFRAEAQMQYGSLGNLKIKARDEFSTTESDVVIDVTSSAVVEADSGSRAQANITPSGQSLGLASSLGFVYNWL